MSPAHLDGDLPMTFSSTSKSSHFYNSTVRLIFGIVQNKSVSFVRVLNNCLINRITLDVNHSCWVHRRMPGRHYYCSREKWDRAESRAEKSCHMRG